MDKFFIKIMLIGDVAVGKTSIRNQFMGEGTDKYAPTVGADFSVFYSQIDGKITTFHIWDLAGQESFRPVRARFLNGAMAGMCIFDVTRMKTLTNITTWVGELWRNSGRGIVPIIIIGNKSDIRDDESVPIEQVMKYAEDLTKNTKSHGFKVQYLETSAKTGENINEAFDIIGRQVIESIKGDTLIHN